MLDLSHETQETTPIPSPTQVRLSLARQLHNVYLERFGRQDPLALAIEASSSQPVLVIQARNEGWVRILEEPETQKVIRYLQDAEVIQRVKQSADRHDDNHEWPEGVRALHKKLSHAHVRITANPDFISAFDQYRKVRFQTSRVAEIQRIVAAIIDEVLNEPETVIETDRRIDVIGKSGQGVRFFRSQDPASPNICFAGLIDPFAYTR